MTLANKENFSTKSPVRPGFSSAHKLLGGARIPGFTSLYPFTVVALLFVVSELVQQGTGEIRALATMTVMFPFAT